MSKVDKVIKHTLHTNAILWLLVDLLVDKGIISQNDIDNCLTEEKMLAVIDKVKDGDGQ